MSPREDLEKFMTPDGRALVDQFMAQSLAKKDDDVNMDKVVRQNLADHEAALTGRPAEPDDDWAPLWSRIKQVATDQPAVQPEQFARILSHEKRPSTLDLALIADTFGVTVPWLLTGDDHGMCAGTIAALQDELRLRTERIRVLEADLPNLVSMCCRQVYGGPHAMACPNYSGPIDHWRVYSVPDAADLTARGLAECTCGVRYPAAGGACPNAAETWRGPKPEDVP